MEADQFNIRHLAAMAAVVDQGSVSLAARAVNLTQPAVTQGIAKLEAQLGVPLFERFYVGGIFSVRGFQRNSLSPTIPVASDKDPGAALVPFKLGGNKEVIFNTEIEIPIFREMGIVGVVFVDAGNAFSEEEALSLMELRTSAGFGFRWWSPMGPLRFEWGFPLAPEEGEQPMVFEFTIGSAF